MDDTRINDLVDIFAELAEVAGGQEETKIYPNLEVINASPADLPAGYIIIEDSEGFYVPALKVPGIVYTTGDKVNVLYIKGTEPVAFQQGSGSSAVGYALNISDEGVDQGNASTLDFVGAGVTAGVAAGVATITVSSGGGGWPFSAELTADPTDPDADYSIVADAITAAAVGDMVVAGAASWNEALDVNKNITLLGRNRRRSIIIQSLLMSASGGELSDVYVYVDGSGTYGVGINATVTIISANAEHWNVADAKAIHVIGGTGILKNVYARSSGSSTSRALEVANGATCTVDESCEFDSLGAGTNFDVYVDGGGSCVLNGPTLNNGTIGGSGTVTGWYRDSTGNVHTINTTGMTDGVWLHDESAGLKIKQADIPTAVAAAGNSGDVIEIGPNTYTAPNVAGGITADKSLAIVGSSPTETVITRGDDSSTTMTISDTPVTLKSLTVEHTGGSGAGSSKNIDNSQVGLVLDDVHIIHTAGTDGSHIGLIQSAGDSLLKNCIINISGGTVTNYALYLYSAASTCVLEGGEILAGDLVTAHASAVIELRGVKLANAVVFNTSSGGTIRGWYYDDSGNLKSVGTTDVYIAQDEAGQKERNVDIFVSSITDHFDTGVFSANWSWAAYAGFVTPGTLDVTTHNSMGLFGTTTAQGAVRAFAYWNTYATELFARVAPLAEMRAGIRLDDGSLNNYFELFLEYSNGLMKLRHRSAAGGVVTGPSDDWGGGAFPIQFAVLRALKTGTGVNYHYRINTPRQILAGSVAATWTGTRSGIYIENLSATGSNLDRTGVFDWYKQQ